METSQNPTESEAQRGNDGGGDEAVVTHAIGNDMPHHHTHHHHHPRTDSMDGGGSANGSEDHQPQMPPQMHLSHSMDHLNEESTGSGLTSTEGGDSSTNPMDDSMGMSRDERTMHEGEGEDDDDDDEEDEEEEDDEDHPAGDVDADEMDEEMQPQSVAKETTTTTTNTTTTAATATAEKPAKKEAATKRFKCLHCSKSYVREFQLNTHVRKYHPEKPIKAAENSTSTTAATPTSGTTTATTNTTTSPSWTQADMEDALESLKSEKMSLVKASQHYGIPASTLWQRATRLGIMIPKNMARTSSKDGVADAVQLLKTGQISVNKASKVFGIPPSTLYKIAKREGIQLSSPFNSATTSWTQENLQLAMDAIRTGQMSVHMASVEFKIPPGTLYGRCKREGLELSRNNPVQWSPRDLKMALEAVKTGQMSINQASEHYKISYSSLYKRVKPHFVNNNNNNNNSNNNQNLSKMGNEQQQQQQETDMVGVGGSMLGHGMDVISMHHHHHQQQQQEACW